MELRVIEGGRAAAGNAGPPEVAEVRAEAARRLRESGCERARVGALLRGAPVPADAWYLQLQITFAADALLKLATIPEDFRHDRYWPAPRPKTAAGRFG